MKICIITNCYPTSKHPNNTFLAQLVRQMTDFGIKCTVIAPHRPLINLFKHNNYNPPYLRKEQTKTGKNINIYSPKYFWATNKNFCGINIAELHAKVFANAVRRVIEKEKIDFDAVYGHFIMPSGFAASEIGKQLKKPSFLAYGESSFDIVGKNFSEKEICKKLVNINGVVAVSGKNRDELIEHGVISPEKIRVFPNAIDNNTFCVMDRSAARKKLGLNEEDFVVAFVGHYTNRKGSTRLSEALKRFDDVKSIFIGSGAEEPTCSGIVYKGRLPHEQIPEYLNAADVFVLPTLAEGCCNAIVEAMACGLPVISSNLPFNDDILNETNSIRINPNSIDEIAEAIGELKSNSDKRMQMAEGALRTAATLTIDKRTQNILSFIKESI